MQRMHQLADEIRETFGERGWKIEKAIELDAAFSKTRRPQSSLGRALVISAIEEATSRIGLGCVTVSGGGCEVSDFVDGVDRRHRVRKADVELETGDYDIISTSDSVLIAEPDSLFSTQQWVLGYTVDDEGLVADIFAARVLGVTEGAVPRLQLGPATLLGAGGLTPPGGSGFRPPDEDDLGAGFDDEFGDGNGAADAS